MIDKQALATQVVPQSSDDTDTPDADVQRPSYWRTKAGRYMIIALTVSGLLLGYENRAVILSSGLLLWLPLLLCVGMHFFMHKGHGGHGSGTGKD